VDRSEMRDDYKKWGKAIQDNGIRGD